jgi:hypothetical protein
MGIPRQMPPNPMRTESPEPPFASPRRTRIRALATTAVFVIAGVVALLLLTA